METTKFIPGGNRFLWATIPEDFEKCYFKFPNPPDEIKLQVLFEPFASGEESG